jgi:uncharacterized protein (DUF1330 family)
MAKAYWVTSYRSISDPEKLAAYARLAGPAIAPFGGRYLARGNAVAAYEAGLKERIVISEFPSVAQAIAAHESAAYQEALQALGNAAVRDLRIVETLDEDEAGDLLDHLERIGEPARPEVVPDAIDLVAQFSRQHRFLAVQMVSFNKRRTSLVRFRVRPQVARGVCRSSSRLL